MKKSRIINIEGIDGTGKQTQAHILKERLIKEGYDAEVVSFPNYDSKTFAIDGIQKVLSGEINDMKEGFTDNSYAVSLLYALDRFLSIDKILKENEGKVIIFDRYVESNISYQSTRNNSSSKNVKEESLSNSEDSNTKARWLYDLEYNKLNLPKPDMTIFLDLPIETSIKLRENREYKSGTTVDIYEEDNEFLSSVAKNSLKLADMFNWNVVPIFDDKKDILPIDDISDKIWNEVKSIL